MAEVIKNNTHTFQIGDRVERIEDREQVSATVISINESPVTGSNGEMEQTVEISYDEGGSGWWPSTCLSALPATQVEEL
jgi:hypothetical protein